MSDIKDNVNHPSHYNQGGIECIEAMAAATEGLNGIEAVDTAQVIKYIWRWKLKNGGEDLCKCVWYLGDLASRIGCGHQFFEMCRKWCNDHTQYLSLDEKD